ncbi:cytochrome c-type biogenesis protein CcmE [Abditibacteriota bacterium]|nr:cytochrome c-type biogenesis protein CcmE [Abditibacteriota bacterium]
MQIRYLAGGAAILAAMGFLVVSSLRAGTTQNVPVQNLRAKDGSSDSFVGRHLRVVGFVGSTPVKFVPRQTEDGVVRESHFQVVEGKATVAVSYTDALPDTFRAGGPVQVDGTYIAPGVLKAEHVLTKCPSKYQAGEKSKPVKKMETDVKPKQDAHGLKS